MFNVNRNNLDTSKQNGGHIFIDLTVQISCFSKYTLNVSVYRYLWYAIFKA